MILIWPRARPVTSPPLRRRKIGPLTSYFVVGAALAWDGETGECEREDDLFVDDPIEGSVELRSGLATAASADPIEEFESDGDEVSDIEPWSD